MLEACGDCEYLYLSEEISMALNNMSDDDEDLLQEKSGSDIDFLFMILVFLFDHYSDIGPGIDSLFIL